MLPSKTPIQKRDWKGYNNALVSRVEIFLCTKVLRKWKKELGKANRHKNGRKFSFPDCFIHYLAFAKTFFGFSYRLLESFISFLCSRFPELKSIDHSTIQRRMAKLHISLEGTVMRRKGLTVSIDSSGLKVHNRGEWIRQKHKLRRGFLKIHFAVNTKTLEIIEMDVTDERVHDNKRFRPLVRRILKKYTLKKVLGDAAYDDHRNFNLLDRLKIKPALKMKKNSFNHKWHPKWDRKHRVRRKYVCMMRKSYKEWKRRLGYGKRWISEIVFSSFKHHFGEHFSSIKPENIRMEIVLRACVHNMLMNHMHSM